MDHEIWRDLAFALRLHLGADDDLRLWRAVYETADGGFAWPSGYDGPAYSRLGLPEHDWTVQLVWDRARDAWRRLRPSDAPPRSNVEFRVSVPARSARHRQAAVHTVWTPGIPIGSGAEATQFYGFRRKTDGWACTATTALDELYEFATEHAHAGAEAVERRAADRRGW